MAVVLANKLNELVTGRFTPAEVNPPGVNAFLAVTIDGSIGRDTSLYGLEYGVLCSDPADFAKIFTISQVVRNHRVDAAGSFFQVDAFATSKSLAYFRLRNQPPFDHEANWQEPVSLKSGADYAIMFIARGSLVVADVLLYLMVRGEFGGVKGGPRLRPI